MNKETIQENQYAFPYHYLTFSGNDSFVLSQRLQWGLIHRSYTDWVTEQIKNISPRAVLDAGCGDGRMLHNLEYANIPSIKTLAGIDISERALHFGRGFTVKPNFYVHDITSNPTDKKHDLCVSIEVIEHIPPEKISDYVKNIHASLEGGGKLIITTPTTNIPVSRKHYQHFTLESLRSYLDEYFSIEQVSYLNHETYWATLLGRLITNKFFTINHAGVLNLIYGLYYKKYFHANTKTGSRIYILAEKK